MTTVRVFQIDNQLAKVVKKPGGKTIEQAVQAAEVRIEAVRETCVAALAEAAFSLCDLTDWFRGGEPANWPAIDVHVDGIRLLATMGPGIGAAGAEAILDGLKRVRARVLPAS